jgi:hypothetical protein
MQCPACKAENSNGPQCRRCKADLSLLFRLESQRDWALNASRNSLRSGDLVEAGRLAVHTDWLRSDAESTKLIAVVAVLSRDFDRALRCHANLNAQISAVPAQD